jgi:peptidoglycan/xylan/chitin deacetylase (PgdA/CDA1 family)
MVGLWQFFRQRNKLAILCYHDPDPTLFARHIPALKAHFNIIALRDYVTARMNNALDGLPPYPLVITMDDGHSRNFQLLEVLAKEKVPVTIFLVSGMVGTSQPLSRTSVAPEDKRATADTTHAGVGFDEQTSSTTPPTLSEQEILAMAAHVDFQGHTRSHPMLPQCSMEKASDEIAGCKTELFSRFGFDIYALAYPYGRYGERDITIAKQAGYTCAVTVEEGLNDISTDPFRLKRMYILDDADPMEAVVKASGLWTSLRRLLGRPRLGAQHNA